MLELECPQTSDRGAYKLSWEGAGGEGATYTLSELSDGAAPVVLYQGTDQATTVSGRVEGVYRYRLEVARGAADAAAQTCEVSVEPPPTPLVAGLFSAGLVVTAATVFLVLRGHRRARRGEL